MEEIISSIIQDENGFFENVKVGDFVDSDEDAFYLSGQQYKTKNKLYEVKEIDVRRDEHGKIYSRSVIVEGDYQNHKTKRNLVWLSPTRVIYRDGKLVWESDIQKSSKLCIELHSHKLSQEIIYNLKSYIYNPL
jgi:hypothetical protein